MTVYSKLFSALALGDAAEGNKLQLELKQLAEQGSLATIMFQSEADERTALGKRAKERRDQEAARNQALTRMLTDPLYREAFESLQTTIQDSWEKLDDWNQQTEERLTEIQKRLDDPNNPLTTAERKRLEEEQRNLLRRQQEMIDLQALINSVEEKANNGDYQDAQALKDAQKDIEQRMDRLERNFPKPTNSSPTSTQGQVVIEKSEDMEIPTLKL